MKELWARHRDRVLVGALFAYVIVLLIGTIGVAFDIQWILDFF
jgi:hypothetical protein